MSFGHGGSCDVEFRFSNVSLFFLIPGIQSTGILLKEAAEAAASP